MTQTMTVYSAQGDAYEIEHDGTVGSIYHAIENLRSTVETIENPLLCSVENDEDAEKYDAYATLFNMTLKTAHDLDNLVLSADDAHFGHFEDDAAFVEDHMNKTLSADSSNLLYQMLGGNYEKMAETVMATIDVEMMNGHYFKP